MTSSITPTADQLTTFAKVPDDTPLVMLNLLRFRGSADYSESPHLAPEEPITGAEAYSRYGDGVLPCLEAVGGSIDYFALTGPTLIGPDGEQWDQIALIRYPSRTAFETMISSEGYLAISGHHQAALADSRLVPTLP